jgi:hypothetical protein
MIKLKIDDAPKPVRDLGFALAWSQGFLRFLNGDVTPRRLLGVAATIGINPADLAKAIRWFADEYAAALAGGEGSFIERSFTTGTADDLRAYAAGLEYLNQHSVEEKKERT